MLKWRSAIATIASVLAVAHPAAAQGRPYTGPKYTRTALAAGVWAFVFDNPLGDQGGVDGTAVVIINDNDVVVVDAQGTPATARRVLAEIRALTKKPVRYVVNTHWHGDHWLGNQVYQAAYPGVEFVAHPHTVAAMEVEEVPSVEQTRKQTVPSQIKAITDLLANGKRRDGTPFSTAQRSRASRQVAALRWYQSAMREITPTMPRLLVADSLILQRGSRTIAIRYLGRGNTRGDLTVWLPREGILATGDLLVNPVPYAFGSYLSEWTKTLGRVRTLPAAIVVPGHGAIQRDWTYLDLFVDMLQSTLAQAKTAVDKGLDLEATRAAVDLRSFRERFARGDDLKGLAFDEFYAAPAVERAWLEARGELEKSTARP